ncbi:Sugar transferase involved in LPS biosynthesis (colanic, teichoic acid) [Roseivivax halotolerans]|uniref:Sugar transferase involved in LPS biosynthesis (Colanic, teichoic acid) n=1 Tax=Roseivivax halotolerans TaxID=93684 RepID=A0A1I5YGM1_9RHOB|nr:sugar transferase [Roseivivax halotolerans]SFQ43067.1 Sugar transferase involved in LPS biosynthesis (colanic, teichoic acid) [Roseivivax halotolerans]
MPRLLEIFLTLALSVVALPLGCLVALLVWAGLGRPIFFRQVRSGQGGRRIVILKFRSMNEDRDESDALLPDEARTNAIGRVIRRFRVDEIPQLLAILRGDLALVGPRPLLPETLRAFGTDAVLRGRVRPGMTGWAQVSGNSRLTDAEKVALDLWYVDHRSAALDMAILGLTVVTLLRGEARAEARIRVAADVLRRRAVEAPPPSLSPGRP